MGGPTASNFTLPHWHIAKRCLCCFWFTAPSHSWVPFIRRSSIGSAKRPQRVCAVARLRFPVGASPARRTLQPEATGAAMEAGWPIGGPARSEGASAASYVSGHRNHRLVGSVVIGGRSGVSRLSDFPRIVAHIRARSLLRYFLCFTWNEIGRGRG